MRRALMVCAEPGCPELTDSTRCETHRRAKRRADDRRRPSASRRGYDARWRAFAKDYLARHPACQWAGCTAPATEVDHRDGQGPLGPHGYDEANLAGLCKPHHSTKTAAVDGSFGRPKVDRGDGLT